MLTSTGQKIAALVPIATAAAMIIAAFFTRQFLGIYYQSCLLYTTERP
jgi:hypothetical protein